MMVGRVRGEYTMKLPWRQKDSANTAYDPQVEWVQVASGETKGQERANPKFVPEVAWTRIEAKKWWEINRWFRDNGLIFWGKFFNHTIGEWQERKFCYKGAEEHPDDVSKYTGMPLFYTDARLIIEDAGAGD